jgi:hypothetical protein
MRPLTRKIRYDFSSLRKPGGYFRAIGNIMGDCSKISIELAPETFHTLSCFNHPNRLLTMTQRIRTLFFVLALGLLFSCNFSQIVKQADVSGSAGQSRRPNEAATDNFSSTRGAQVSFEDRTQEIVRHAETLIETNQKEGAVLDQRWYGLKYFGKHQELILNAANVTFFGGLENDARHYLGDRYTSIDAVEENQDSGDIRLYIGKRKGGSYDFIVVGQNGREVALKTTIRLLYLIKFADDETKRKYRDKLASFTQSLRVLLSSVSARDEFITFFNKHGISNPDR